MGRELKRVPMDFDWPPGNVWGGYIDPFCCQSIQCPQCKGTGSSPEANDLKDVWYGWAPFKPEDWGSKPFLPTHPSIREQAKRNVASEHNESIIQREAHRLCNHYNSSWMHHLNDADVAALVHKGRLVDLTHTWTPESKWQPKEPPYVPTPQEVNDWSIRGFGHDAINQWICVTAECQRRGYPTECTRCHGEGTLWPTPEMKKQSEEWEPTQPPIGDGYQIWETVSEGSPVSPVFETPEDLAEWMAVNAKGVDQGTTKEQWLKFILGPGWAPSFIGSASGVKTGVQSISKK